MKRKSKSKICIVLLILLITAVLGAVRFYGDKSSFYDKKACQIASETVENTNILPAVDILVIELNNA